MTDPRDMSAAAQGREIAGGRFDPRELAEAYLAAIEAESESARIFARVTAERARAEAAGAAGRQQAGLGRGPLDGVCLAWKDNIDSAGIATEAGSRLLAGRLPEIDAPVLARATAAGTVCLGKTHLSELAFSGLGVNPMAATPPNTSDPARAPGGSSSGTAVAVRSGLAAAGVGSDTGGSVRIPAAWNGLVGLRTTPGVLPTAGVVPLAPSFDTVGPMARTVEDAGLLLAAMGGPAWDATAPEPGEIRLKIAETVVLDGCDPEIPPPFEAAAERLASAGVLLTRGPVAAFSEATRVMAEVSPVVTGEAWRTWGAVIEANPGVMWPLIEARFRQGARSDPQKDSRALTLYAEVGRRLSAEMAETGPLAMPTTANIAPLVADLLADEGYYVERNLLALRNTRLANLLGLPALTLPLPAPYGGLMVMGPQGGDAALLRLGLALERILAD